MKWSRRRDRARQKRVHFVNVRVGRVECAEMQHSPSSATNPEAQRMNRDLVLRERFREDVRGHIFCRTIFDVDLLVGNGLSYEMVLI
jgi:hypothetical protein